MQQTRETLMQIKKIREAIKSAAKDYFSSYTVTNWQKLAND
jgi:hypothetical protein